MQFIKINYYVMPDVISLPRQLLSRGHPVSSLDSGLRRTKILLPYTGNDGIRVFNRESNRMEPYNYCLEVDAFSFSLQSST